MKLITNMWLQKNIGGCLFTIALIITLILQSLHRTLYKKVRLLKLLKGFSSAVVSGGRTYFWFFVITSLTALNSRSPKVLEHTAVLYLRSRRWDYSDLHILRLAPGSQRPEQWVDKYLRGNIVRSQALNTSAKMCTAADRSTKTLECWQLTAEGRGTNFPIAKDDLPFWWTSAKI